MVDLRDAIIQYAAEDATGDSRRAPSDMVQSHLILA